MARSAAIPLVVAGVGAVFVISGIEGESLAEVLKGQFGKGTSHESPSPTGKETQSGSIGSPGVSEAQALREDPFGTARSPAVSSANVKQQSVRELAEVGGRNGLKREIEKEIRERKLSRTEGERYWHFYFPGEPL